MQGKKQRSDKLFYQISLEDLVDPTHELRRLHQGLDMRFLYKRTRSYYGRDGQVSIDPVDFFKMCLIGFLYNIPTDRGIVRYCKDSLAARWFLHYDLDEALPVHSTLSRTRKLFGEQVFSEVFDQVLSMCVDKGLVDGQRQIVDSALSKANASMDSLQRRKILELGKAYTEDLERHSWAEEQAHAKDVANDTNQEPGDDGAATGISERGSKQAPHASRSNKTWTSPTDSDARIARKPGKPTNLYYRTQVGVDGLKGVITTAFAQYANQNDDESLPRFLRELPVRLNRQHLTMSHIVADSGYSHPVGLQSAEQLGIQSWIPNPSGFRCNRVGFSEDPASNTFTCRAGKTLTYQHTRMAKGLPQEVYATQSGACQECVFADVCKPTQGRKRLYSTPNRERMIHMEQRLSTPEGQAMMRRRKAVVEPVLGSLLHFYGLRKIWTRGLESATKQVLLASAAFNLRKWLKVPEKPHFKGTMGVVFFTLCKLSLKTVVDEVIEPAKTEFKLIYA